MRCKVCGYEHHVDATYCSKCGTKICYDILCMECGYKLSSDAIYCSKCGTKISGKPRCNECGYEIFADSSYCMRCGARVKDNSITSQNNKGIHLSQTGKKILAIIIIAVLYFVIYGVISSLLGWRYGGGVLPFFIFIGIAGLVWRSMTK